MRNKTYLVLAVLAALASPAFAAPRVQWTWNLPARKPAWEFNSDISRDLSYIPVIQGNLVLIGCEHNGAVLAVDLETGQERWRYYTDGPVRIAPLADAERIYVASDDGHLHCLDHSGKRLWKVRGGPSARKILAHERLTSAWPSIVPPALIDGKIYYVAGVWPVDGVFIHALDAKTGDVLWTNSGAQYRPTGTLRVAGPNLFIGGHHGSGIYDTATGAEVIDKTLKAPPVEKVAPKELADGRKIVVSPKGEIQCVAEKDVVAKTFGGAAKGENGNFAAVDAVLDLAKTKDGYCVVVALEDGALIEGILKRSKMRVIALDANAAKVDAIRRQLDAAGLFDDHRLELQVNEKFVAGLPPYLASLVVNEKSFDSSSPLTGEARDLLRPHGGVWIWRITGGRHETERRNGPPTGSADWTHEFGNAANTLSVRDKLVKAPLGTLWYGGPQTAQKYYFQGKEFSPNPVSPEVIDGRLILQGPGVLAAFDSYTGRLFWEAPLPKFFAFGSLGVHSKDFPHPVKTPEAQKFEILPSQRGRPGGFNMVSTPDGIYVGAGPTMVRFYPVDGKRMSEWKVPLDEKDLCWGSIRAVGKTLIATAFHPQDMIDADAGYDGNGGEWSGDRMPMAYLLALDRDSGKLLWSRKAAWGFLNRGGVAIGGDKVFCIDLLLESAFAKFRDADRKFPETPPTVNALDLQTGAVVWSRPLEYRAKGIVYSAERNMLVVPCRNKIVWKDGVWVNAVKAKGLDALKGNMRGLRASDGKLLWEVNDETYNDPPLLLDDVIFSRNGATFDLQTGKRSQIKSPLTGELEQWSFSKAGCNHLIGCDALITWRTGFFDLAGGTGSMPLKEMEAGCTPTLIPSGGVLNIPNLGNSHLRARMVAMALVHVPENAFWAINARKADKAAPASIARAGFLFGVPGSRKADDETVWLPVNANTTNFASVKGPKLEWLQLHPAKTGDWKASSGVVGATEIIIPVTLAGSKSMKDAGKKRLYDVRLHFVEPKALKVGERVFSVSLEGKTVVKDLDVTKEANGPLRRVTREFQNIEIDGPLDIQLTATTGASLLTGVELIAR